MNNLSKMRANLLVRVLVLFAFALTIYGCKSKKGLKQEPKASININSKPQNGDVSTISGNVKNLLNKEPVAFADVVLFINHKMILGARTDSDGKFQIKSLISGQYLIKISADDFNTLEMSYEIKQPSFIQVEVLLEQRREQVEKPVVYFYPTEKKEISVRLNYKGELTHSYPPYPENGWKIIADPDGTLWDSNGQEYYALFWEGKANAPLIPKNGFVVPGKITAAFLEEKLAYLGLNRREANEFIMYWLPRMENNAYNFIHFAGVEYEQQAELIINPKPETCIRVMMLTQALPAHMDIPLQDLTKMKKIRQGYTVVEWGGSVIHLFDM